MTYEQRWGHKRFRKAMKHLAIKEQKRKEAEERNAKYRTLSPAEKYRKVVMLNPGFSLKQLARLTGNPSEYVSKREA